MNGKKGNASLDRIVGGEQLRYHNSRIRHGAGSHLDRG